MGISHRPAAGGRHSAPCVAAAAPTPSLSACPPDTLPAAQPRSRIAHRSGQVVDVAARGETMRVPPSPHFTPVPLDTAFNADRKQLTGGLAPQAMYVPDWSPETYGERAFRGIPFVLGEADTPNVIVLEPGGPEVRIELGRVTASYLVFLHAVEDRPAPLPASFGQTGPSPGNQCDMGNPLGHHVADYALVYEDGTEAVTPVRRRFQIQQRHLDWGASPFEAVSAISPSVLTSATEDHYLGRVASNPYGDGETRTNSGRPIKNETLWLYALQNPTPERSIRALALRPGSERAAIYAIS